MDRSTPRTADVPETVGTGAPARFRFDVDRSYAVPARLFGVDPGTALVTVTADRLVARFGPWRVETPLANIASTEFSGPFAYPKTVGPAHLTFSDRGLTFATTSRQGLMIHFRRPVRGGDPFGLLRHPNLTVTVLDREGLAAALQPDVFSTAPRSAAGGRS